jgi:hypothetical protein
MAKKKISIDAQQGHGQDENKDAKGLVDMEWILVGNILDKMNEIRGMDDNGQKKNNHRQDGKKMKLSFLDQNGHTHKKHDGDDEYKINVDDDQLHFSFFFCKIKEKNIRMMTLF